MAITDFRMLGQGVDSVVCLEPNLSHLTQFIAINNFVQFRTNKNDP